MQHTFGLMLLLGRFALLPFSIVILSRAAYLFDDTRSWIGRSVGAQGKESEMARVRAPGTGSISFAPVVRFQTAMGDTVEFQSTFQSNPPAYSTGQIVRVLYDPNRPNSAAIAGLFSVWGTTIVLSAVGAMFLAF